jgi:multiple sugar transport system permease protein
MTEVAAALPAVVLGTSFKRTKRVTTAVLGLFLVYTFFPLFYLFVASTKTNFDLFSTFGLWFGKEFRLFANLRDLFAQSDGVFSRWLLNTLLYSLAAGVGAATLATAAGYAFAKFSFRGRELLFAVILGAVMIPQTALVVPTFLLLAREGLTDSPLGVILPSMISPIGVYLMRVYIEQGIDDALLDAARMDGASEWRIFGSIVFRLVAPGFVTVLLLSFVATWNNYFLPLIVLRSPEYFPLTVGLASWYQLASQGGGGGQAMFSLVLTGALVSVVPVIAVFLILQRFWQGGLTLGAVR